MAWEDILGQESAKTLLQTHLTSGTVAHAYLLAGPEGIGKRLLAIEMAKALNCLASSTRPCDACVPCKQIARGTHPDIHHVITSGASDQIKIETIRQMIGRVALRPFNAAFQVAIIDGAERLTEEAANSLLKVLEEPPTHTRFLLLTAQLSSCLPTIVSRCQLIRCQPLPPEVVKQILMTQQGSEARVAEAIAPLANGSASQAIELAQRWSVYEQQLQLFGSPTTSTWYEQSLPDSREGVAQFLDGMTGWLRDLAVTAVSDAPLVHQGQADALRRQAAAIDLDHCLEMAFELVALRESLEQFVSPRLVAAVAREKWLSLIHHV